MRMVLSFRRMAEAEPYMDTKVMAYLKERQIETFESFESFDLVAFDWYDVHSERTEDSQMLLYLDRQNLFVFCEDAAAESKASVCSYILSKSTPSLTKVSDMRRQGAPGQRDTALNVLPRAEA